MKNTERVISYDIIRSVAIFFVICIHSLGLVNDALPMEISIGQAHVTNALMGIVYSGVPLFVMLSGALLLGKEEPLGTFFQRRLARVLMPFLLWSFFVYAILYWQKGERSIIGFVCSYATKSLTEGVYGIYWYIYMLLGLYAITPHSGCTASWGKVNVFLLAFADFCRGNCWWDYARNQHNKVSLL